MIRKTSAFVPKNIYSNLKVDPTKIRLPLAKSVRISISNESFGQYNLSSHLRKAFSTSVRIILEIGHTRGIISRRFS